MELIWYNEPWEHFEVKDFLSPEELQVQREYFSNLSVPDGKTGKDRIEKYRHNNYHKPEYRENWDRNTKFLEHRFINLLNQIPAKWNPAQDEVHIEYDRIYPGFEWQIHNDVWTKRVSFILQISEYGHGTRLYEKFDGSGKKRTVNWIPGGGGGFIRGDETHHSFDTLEDSTIRQTVILTSRQKGTNWRNPPK